MFFFVTSMISQWLRSGSAKEIKGKTKENQRNKQRKIKGTSKETTISLSSLSHLSLISLSSLSHLSHHLSLLSLIISHLSLQSSFRSLPRIQIARIRFAGGSPGAPGEMDARDLYSGNASKTLENQMNIKAYVSSTKPLPRGSHSQPQPHDIRLIVQLYTRHPTYSTTRTHDIRLIVRLIAHGIRLIGYGSTLEMQCQVGCLVDQCP